MTQLWELSAVELVDGFRQRSISPVEALQAILRRVEHWEPHINATWALDADQALAQATVSEELWRRGAPRGPLEGVPITLKDNIATEGVPTPRGTAAVELFSANADAPPAARAREAGAVIFSKTSMPDFGMLGSGVSSFHGVTRNPWDVTKNPGGSSSGAAAAAAAGYGPLHVGTDLGGSVRLPAGWCGVFGLKPSLGRVPVGQPYMGHVAGPLTRNVSDAALLLSVLSRPDVRDHMSLPYQALDWHIEPKEPKGLKIGLLLDAGCGLPTSPEVRRAVQVAAALFATAGAVVEPVDPFLTPRMLAGIDEFWRMHSYTELATLPQGARQRALGFIEAWSSRASERDGPEAFRDYAQTFLIRQVTYAASLLYDYVLSPVAPIAAYPAEYPCPTNDPASAIEHIAFTLPYNLSELPAASINCGYTGEGLPIGIQIAGRRFDDLGVLSLAAWFERARHKQRHWPEPPGSRSTNSGLEHGH